MTRKNADELPQNISKYPDIPLEIVNSSQQQINDLLSFQTMIDRQLPVYVQNEDYIESQDSHEPYTDIEIVEAEILDDNHDIQENRLVEFVVFLVVVLCQSSFRVVVFLVRNVASLVYYLFAGLLYCIVEIIMSVSSRSDIDRIDDVPRRRNNSTVNVETNVWVTGNADVSVKTNIYTKNE